MVERHSASPSSEWSVNHVQQPYGGSSVNQALLTAMTARRYLPFAVTNNPSSGVQLPTLSVQMIQEDLRDLLLHPIR